MDNVWDKKVVAVVGASGAFGQRFVTQLADLGAQPVAFSRQISGLSLPHDVPAVAADITDPEAGVSVVASATERFGRLDGVINATGTVGFGSLTDTTEAHLEELMLVNALGPLWLTKQVAPALAETQGFVLHISGVVSEAALPGMAAYCASKSALAAGLVSTRRDLRRSKVRVFDARPPHTETGLADRPLFGQAPRMQTGLEPDVVVSRILKAVQENQFDIPSADF